MCIKLQSFTCNRLPWENPKQLPVAPLRHRMSGGFDRSWAVTDAEGQPGHVPCPVLFWVLNKLCADVYLCVMVWMHISKYIKIYNICVVKWTNIFTYMASQQTQCSPVECINSEQPNCSSYNCWLVLLVAYHRCVLLIVGHFILVEVTNATNQSCCFLLALFLVGPFMLVAAITAGCGCYCLLWRYDILPPVSISHQPIAAPVLRTFEDPASHGPMACQEATCHLLSWQHRPCPKSTKNTAQETSKMCWLVWNHPREPVLLMIVDYNCPQKKWSIPKQLVNQMLSC